MRASAGTIASIVARHGAITRKYSNPLWALGSRFFIRDRSTSKGPAGGYIEEHVIAGSEKQHDYVGDVFALEPRCKKPNSTIFRFSGRVDNSNKNHFFPNLV